MRGILDNRHLGSQKHAQYQEYCLCSSLPTLSLLMSRAGGRATPVVIRAKELSLNPTSYITKGSGPAFFQGTIIELKLLAQTWESQP